MTVLEKVTALLKEQNIQFTHTKHAPIYTSEESARARGEALKDGAKAMLFKIDGTFKLFVLSAAKKIESRALREYFKAKKIRMATPEEILSLWAL